MATFSAIAFTRSSIELGPTPYLQKLCPKRKSGREPTGQNRRLRASGGLYGKGTGEASEGYSAISNRPSLSAQLPRFQRFDRINQHQDFQQETVSNPEYEHQLSGHENEDTAFEAEPQRNHEAGDASQYVAKRVEDGVAVVAERGGRFAISLDNKLCVFEYLPGSFQECRQRQAPGCRYAREGQCQQPTECKAMKDMRE